MTRAFRAGERVEMSSKNMATGRFAYIWQYEIHPARREEFLAAYNPNGEWANLFSSDPSYLGTRLLQDAEDENRYATIDYWTSRADRDDFRVRFAEEFDQLDRRCENFTRGEKFIGDYTEVEDGH